MPKQLQFDFPRRLTFFSGRIMVQLKLIFPPCRLFTEVPVEQIGLFEAPPEILSVKSDEECGDP